MSIAGETEFNEGDYKENSFPSLLELSDDLKTIFEQGLLSDIVLFVNGKDIRCHKDILSIRSKWFSLRIRQASSSGITSIKINENNQILNAVLAYIYTGNLQLLESLNIPLVDLRNAADKYGLTNLKMIVTDVIKSESILDKTKSIEFLWNVQVDCNSQFISDCSALKDFSLHGSDEWGLEIQPLFRSDGKCIIEIYLTRKIANDIHKMIHIVNISVHVVDSRAPRQLMFKGELTVSEDGKYKIVEFVPRSDQRDNLGIISPGATLAMSCELSVCGKLGDIEGFKLKGLYRRYVPKELLSLSQDMLQMLKMGKYSDISVKLKGCSLFRLHSYIIYGRSRLPVPALSRLGDEAGFGSVVWRSFIFYLYTGQTRYLDDHMRVIYNASRKLAFIEPTQKYENILANNLNIHNAFGILCDSVINGDTYLMSCAARFLACNSGFLSESKTWINIASNNSARAVFQNQFI